MSPLPDYRASLKPENIDCLTKRNWVEASRKWLEINPGLVLELKIQIETGRRHQIRGCLASLGYPLVSDDIYSPMKGYLLAGRSACEQEINYARNYQRSREMKMAKVDEKSELLWRMDQAIEREHPIGEWKL